MSNRRSIQHRAGPLFGAVLLVVVGALAFTPAVPPVGAIDPTPSPEVETPARRRPIRRPTPTPDPTPEPAPDPTPTPTPDPTPGADPTPTPDADPDPGRHAHPDPAAPPTPSPTPHGPPSSDARADARSDAGATPTPTPSVVRATLDASTDAPATGRHRVDPGSDRRALPGRPASSTPPPTCASSSPASGLERRRRRRRHGRPRRREPSRGASAIWPPAPTSAVAATLRAPVLGPAGEPAFEAVVDARLEHAGGTAATATTALLVAPALVVEHTVLARIAHVTHDPDLRRDRRRPRRPGPLRLVPGSVPGPQRRPRSRWRWRPGSSTRPAGEPGFVDVPVGESEDGTPFYVDAEWRPAAAARAPCPGPPRRRSRSRPCGWTTRTDRRRTRSPVAGFMDEGTRGAPRPPGRLVHRDRVRGPGLARHRPGPAVPAPAHRRRSRDRRGGRRDGRHRLRPSRTRSRPTSTAGSPVGPPEDAIPAARRRRLPARGAGRPPRRGRRRTATPRYALAIAVPAAPGVAAPLAAPFRHPTCPDTTLASDMCAACHRAHVAQGSNLLAEAAPQAAHVLHLPRRHGLEPRHRGPVHGPGRSRQRRRDAQLLRPRRDDDARPSRTPTPSPRTTSSAACPTATACAPTATTRTTRRRPSPPRRRPAGRSPASSSPCPASPWRTARPDRPPTYTFRDGSVDAQATREYELCLKCHSGFTTLAAERRPAAVAAGRRQGDRAEPLQRLVPPGRGRRHERHAADGLEPGQLVAVQAVELHDGRHGPLRQLPRRPAEVRRDDAAGRRLRPGAAHQPVPRDPHPELPRPRAEGARRGVRRGRLRPVLRVPRRAAVPQQHADEHGLRRSRPPHVVATPARARAAPTSTRPAQGGGNAICAECHFRTHGTAQAVNPDDRSNPRLVNFAPNVEPFNGVLEYTKTATGGSCTLVCHGKAHDHEAY